jgi:hypothetical protein
VLLHSVSADLPPVCRVVIISVAVCDPDVVVHRLAAAHSLAVLRNLSLVRNFAVDSLAVVGSPVVTGTLFQQGETLRTRIGIKIGEEPGVMSVVLTMKPNRKMLSQKALADFLPQVSSQSAIPSLLALLCWCLSL